MALASIAPIRRGRRPNAERHDRVRLMVAGGIPPKEIRVRLGISKTRTYEILARLGQSPRGGAQGAEASHG